MKLLLAQLAPAGNDGSGGLHVEPGEGDRDDDDLVFESRLRDAAVPAVDTHLRVRWRLQRPRRLV